MKNYVVAKSNVKRDVEAYEISKVTETRERDKVVKNTIFKSLDMVLSSAGGFVEEQIVALGSQPGIGKSTLCSMIADKDAIYISTEESRNQINSRFLRVNPNRDADIVSVTDIEAIIEIIETSPKNFIIIDSLNNINNGVDGYARQAQNMIRIASTMKKFKKYGIIVSQVGRKGEIIGMNAILHTVDTVVYLERSAVSDHLILNSNKNRFGEIGSISIFEHTKNGLIEVDDFKDVSLGIGETFADARFGYKTMKVKVEALVAATNLNYGQCRVNGLNLSRVQQILAVLSTNSKKINFSNKDVYVRVSNGITVSDSKLDLSIVNSILSSYFQVEPKVGEIVGEVNLNGSIRNNNKFKHIKDLIHLYSNN